MQNDILDKQYMSVVLQYAKEDGLCPLGQYIYYDALVVHGSGDSADCFEAIRNAAHSDLSRLNAQRKFLSEKNFDLTLPLEWTMYGDAFSLTEDQIGSVQ